MKELCFQNKESLMKNMTMIKKIVLFTLLVFLNVAFLTGCGNLQAVMEKQHKLRNQGMKEMTGGRYEEAIKKFDGALEISNGKIAELELDVCYQKSVCQFKSGLTNEALETISALLKYDRKDSKAYYIRGSI